MKKSIHTKTIRIGLISLFKRNDVWYAYYTLGKKRHRISLKTSLKNKAVEMAETIDRKIRQAKAMLPKEQEQDTITIKDAFNKFLASKHVRAKTLNDYYSTINQFADWLWHKHPEIELFSELLPFHINNYIGFLQSNNKSFDQIRKSRFVIRGTCHCLMQNFPESFSDITFGIKLKRTEPIEIKTLPIENINRLISAAQEKAIQIYSVICLQLFVGLRMEEAINIRPCDIDKKNKTISILKTRHHTPKNLPSFRTLPIPEFIYVLLCDLSVGKSINEYCISYNHESPPNVSYISRAIKKIFKQIGEPKLKPRDLRKTFATLVSNLEVPYRLIQKYMGHSSGDILGKHYEQIGIDRLQRIPDTIQKWIEKNINKNSNAKIISIAE